jgi:hypothetical protein
MFKEKIVECEDENVKDLPEHCHKGSMDHRCTTRTTFI